MKKTLTTVIILASLIAFFACNGNQEKETTNKDAQNQEEKAENQDCDDKETTYSPQVYDIKELKSGDQVEGFKVKEVKYKEGDEYMLELSGQQKFSGHFEINVVDFSIMFVADKKLQSKLNVFGSELSLNGLQFTNEDEVKKLLGKEKMAKLEKEQDAQIPATIKVSGLTSMGKMHSSYWSSTKLLKIIE